MTKKSKPYRAYLLRIWQVREIQDTWRVALEDASTRELRGFASLEEVFEFLQREVEGEASEEEINEGEEKVA